MSGAKRKGAYRKSVVESTTSTFPVPMCGERVCRITELRGGNLLEVEDGEGDVALAMMPTRFKNVIWVKPGDFVIAGCENDDASAKVRFIVNHVLYAAQIEHLKVRALWPPAFSSHASARTTAVTSSDRTSFFEGPQDDADDDDDLFVNTNRIVPTVDVESDDSDDD